MILTKRIHKDGWHISIGRDHYAPRAKARVFIVQKMRDWATVHGVFFRSDIVDGKRRRQFVIHAFGRRIIDICRA